MLIRPTRVAAVSCQSCCPYPGCHQVPLVPLLPFLERAQARRRTDVQALASGRPMPPRTRVQRSGPILLPGGEMRRVRSGPICCAAMPLEGHYDASTRPLRKLSARERAVLIAGLVVTAVAVLALLSSSPQPEPLLDEHGGSRAGCIEVAVAGMVGAETIERLRRRRRSRSAAARPRFDVARAETIVDGLHRGRRPVLSAGASERRHQGDELLVDLAVELDVGVAVVRGRALGDDRQPAAARRASAAAARRPGRRRARSRRRASGRPLRPAPGPAPSPPRAAARRRGRRRV